MKSELRTQWQATSLDTIVRYFSKGFQPINDYEEIISVEHYIDVHKNKVVFELTIRDKREN